MFNGTSSDDLVRTGPTIHHKKDGPMLLCTDGSAVFLTLRERFQLRFGFTTLEKLEQKHIRLRVEADRKANLRNKFMRL